jgi:hypothetical protein
MPLNETANVFRISRLGWLGIALVVLAPWTVVLWMMTSAPASTPPAVAVDASRLGTITSDAGQKSGQLPIGPWGDLEYSTVMIEPPAEAIPVDDSIPQPPKWSFNGYTESKLTALWESAGLTAAQRQTLDDPAIRKMSSSGLVLQPRVEDVVDLSPAARAKIYTALAEFPENVPQCEPFRFRADSVDDWFEGTDLAPETIALTRSLLYQRNEIVLFSDHDIVLRGLASTAERIRFLKAVSRKPALLVQLRLKHGQETESLARYWGRGRRSKDIEPLLASLARRPDGGTLDLIHLLPRFARSLIYTFPLPSDNRDDENHDCHWTSLNFYNDPPDEQYSKIDLVKRTLESSYYPVAGEPMLGDIILMLRPGGVVIHSCVFIADDIVFTKNGPGYSVPWQIARLDYVVSFYGRGQELELRRYRRKDL